MKVDHLILLESFFLPEYRNRLVPMMKALFSHDTSMYKGIIELQVRDLREKEEIVVYNPRSIVISAEGKEVDKDVMDFTILLLTYKKALLNKMRAFKVLKSEIVRTKSAA